MVRFEGVREGLGQFSQRLVGSGRWAARGIARKNFLRGAEGAQRKSGKKQPM